MIDLAARRRRGWGVAGVLLAALLLASVPYLYAYRVCPPGYRFWAVPPVNSSDANQYTAFTRTVAEGHLLFGDPFTTEAHPPGLFLPQVLFQAALCRVTGCTPLDAFQVSRLLSGVLLLAAGWWLGTLFLAGWRARWLYLGLLCFSAGAGWFADRLGFPNHGDALQPEGNTFFTLGNLPHLSLSAALLTALFGTLRAYERKPQRRWLAFTAGAALLLSWTHPFDFATLALGLGSYGIARWVQYRRLPRASALHATALLVGALPAIAYFSWLTATQPVYRALESDVLKVLDFPFYAIAHGLLALPALVVLALPRLRSRYLLPLCWVGCVFLFLLTPFRLGGKQPRLLGGIHVPLALLAAVGIDAVARAVAGGLSRSGERRRARRANLRTQRYVAAVLCGFYFLVTATGVGAMVQRQMAFYAPRQPDFFQSPAVQGLFTYLGKEGRAAEVVLGGDYTAGWAPTWADPHTYYGHWHMTLDAWNKVNQRNWLFTQTLDPRARAAWLQQNRVTWIIWYPWEWRGQCVPLDGVPGVRRVYESPEILLYRFDPGAALPPVRPGDIDEGLSPRHD